MKEKQEIKQKSKLVKKMEDKLNIIKQKALEEHIPILMDDTLAVILDIIKKEKPCRLLEIGTATRLLCYMFRTSYGRKYHYRHY